MKAYETNFKNMAYVVRNLRDWDRREIMSSPQTHDLKSFIAGRLRFKGTTWIYGVDRPVYSIGAVPAYPGVWRLWGFATDEWPQVALSVTKFVRRVMLPMLGRMGAQRLEFGALDGNETRRAWLEMLGAKFESQKVGAGRGGENYNIFVVERDRYVS